MLLLKNKIVKKNSIFIVTLKKYYCKKYAFSLLKNFIVKKYVFVSLNNFIVKNISNFIVKKIL